MKASMAMQPHKLHFLSSPFSYSSSFTLLLFLVLTLNGLAGNTVALVKLPPNVKIPAVLVFGDSIVDSGNNNNLLLPTAIKCNFPPYGVDFPGRVSTGRFCDGRVPSDIIAEELGIKSIIPAYLDPNLQPQDLPTGVSFASGGTGYDPLTPKLVSVLSMADQMNQFKEYVGRLRATVGEERTKFIVGNSMYVVVAGSDDIANTYFTLRVRKAQYDVPSYTDLMANYASNFFQELYKMGARRVSVFSSPPIGCVPSQRDLMSRQCNDPANQAASLFNSKLSGKVTSLRKTYSDSRFVYIDVYNALLDIIKNPTKYGYEVSDKGCCGTGAIEVAILCNKLTPITCANISTHVFWDSYHPTERTYKLLVSLLLNKYLKDFF